MKKGMHKHSPPRQRARISNATLEDAFPFIQRGGTENSVLLHASPTATDVHSQSSSPIDVPLREFPSEIFRDLTKCELLAVLEFLHYAPHARTVDATRQLLQLIQRVVACPGVIGGVVRLNSNGAFHEFNSVINVSYSNEWLYTYGRNGYASVDPVLQQVLATSEAQVWKQTYTTAASPKEIEFIEEACSHGLTHGITTSMLERGSGFASFFSFAGGDIKNTIRCMGLLEYLRPVLHRLAMAHTNIALPSHTSALSPRETMVLNWMKLGKTNWEISQIIGVSERTVRFHVESIFVKLDVGSRTQAVAFAIEHGLLVS